MKNLNEVELETVAGGVPFLAMPALVAVLARPHPEPSDEPVPSERPTW
ncbi:MAG: hypothetical protein AAF250_08955 [Pseudomonadota bacterium]